MNFFSDPFRPSASFALPSRAVLSPMEGIMNRDFFFDAAHSLGLIDSWMPPFLGISRGAVPSLGKLEKRFARYRNSGIPLTVQLLGNDADTLAETALRLAACSIRSVNLNFACPSKTVLGSGSGGALLRDAVRAAQIAAAVHRRVPELCLSVKLRSGFSAPEESADLLRRLGDAGVSWFVFHFRTVRENYSFVERSEALRRITTAVRCANGVPVFGNGDILTADDALLMQKETQCAGIAVGRGFLKNPFLLRELRGMRTDGDPRRLFLDTLLSHAGASAKQKRNFYLECVKMAYGAESFEFRAALKGK